MKKFTLLAALALGAVTMNAQNVLVERAADDPTGTGLISTNGADDAGVFCADYFTVSSDVALGNILINGFSSSGAAIEPFLEGFDVFVYANGADVPDGTPSAGDALYDISNIDITGSGFELVQDDGTTVFRVNFTDANGGSQVVLPAGNYWMSIAPRVTGASGGDGRFNWAGSASTPDVQPVLIDEGDLFGVGATDWTNISTLIGQDFTALSWTLVDEPLLSVGDNIADVASVYPNPTNDVLNVNIPSNIEIESATLVDVLGRDTGLTLSNGTINTSNLANGVYVLNVVTSAGTLVEKIVKQ